MTTTEAKFVTFFDIPGSNVYVCMYRIDFNPVATFAVFMYSDLSIYTASLYSCSLAIEMTTEPPVVCPTVPSTTPVISSNSSLFNCSTHISDKEPHHLIATCSASFIPGPLENTTCSFNGNPFQFCECRTNYMLITRTN